MNSSCIFCKIISNLIPSKKIYETESVLVIQDISPKAPIHYLIIPKQHVAGIAACTESEQQMLGMLLLTARHLSIITAGASEFKIVSNNGASVGQSVFHLHIHFLAGGGNYLEQASV